MIYWNHLLTKNTMYNAEKNNRQEKLNEYFQKKEDGLTQMYREQVIISGDVDNLIQF